jgi:RHS repeat-associated protein
MPTWSVTEPYISLWLHDEPLGYDPAVGPRISFNLAFKQREGTRGFDPTVFGVGKKWTCSWLSFVTQDQGTNTVFLSGGGELSFSSTNLDYFTHTRLTGDTNAGFSLVYPDGSSDVYAFVVTNSAGTFKKAFLSRRVNPQGQRIVLAYSNYDPSSPVIRLQSIVDGDGRTNTVHYEPSNAYSTNLISEVVDAFGRSAVLTYNNYGDLTNITDVAGISSSMSYNINHWVTNLTTPYGITSFLLTDGTNSSIPNGRSILVTQPNNSHELYLFNDIVTGLPSIYSTVPNTTPFSSIFPDSLYDRVNSFHWDSRQYAALSTTNVASFTALDYMKARMQHWLWTWDPSAGTFVDETVGLKREPSPDSGGTIEGQKTWYDYSGRDAGSYTGTNKEPLFVGQILPDGSSAFVRTERNALGRIVRTVATYHGGLRTNLFNYDSNGIDLLSTTNALGIMVTSNSYNAYHQATVHLDALGQATTFTYNTTQQVTSITSPTGLILTNIYANDNSLVTQILVGFATNSFSYSNDLIAAYTDARGLTVGNTWDPLGRLTGQQFPDGSYASNIYAALDLAAARDRMGNWTTFGYDSMRRNTSITNALGYITLFSYCGCGSLESVLDAGNNVTSFYYDNQGNLTNTIYADGYSVQRKLNLLHQAIITSDSTGNSATNAYNNQGLLTSIKNAAGNVAVYSFDSLDRVINSVDANAVSINTSYDSLGRLLARTYPDGGGESFGYTQNVSGYTSHTNQNGNVTVCAYDALGRKTCEVFVGVSTNQFGFDGVGDLLTLTDGRNQVTTWNYDEYGRVTNKVDAGGIVSFVYQYDPTGQLTNRWTPAKGNTAYTYDQVGNRTNINYGGGTSISFAFDHLNRLTNMVDALGTTRFTYDAVGELLSSGGLWSGDTVSYSYIGRVRSSLAFSGWTNSYLYDAALRLTNITSPAGSFGYRYDSTRAMQVGTLSLPNGAYIANTYDTLARLTGTYLKNTANDVLDGYTYGYDQLGQRTNIVRDYGMMNSTVSVGYDSVGEIKSWTAKEANGVPRLNEQLGYGYDAAGNLTWRTNNAFIQAFKVDAANALTNIIRGGRLTVSGNTAAPASRVNVNGTPAVTYADFTFASSNAFDLADGQNTFTNIAANYYGDLLVTNILTSTLPANIVLQSDANGNLSNDGARSFGYDAENHLTNITVSDQWKSDFLYDGLGRRRIARDYTWQSGAWTLTSEVRYIYDEMLIIQERDSNNAAKVTYTRGLDLLGSLQVAGGIGGLLARTDANGSTFYHVDGNGSVTALIDSSQYISARYLYDPFGRPTARWGRLAELNAMQLSSIPRHSHSGLSLYPFRAYDPNFQRWLNPDPIGEQGGMNLFAFVGNNPINKVDPLGTTEIDWHHIFVQQFEPYFDAADINIHDQLNGILLPREFHRDLHSLGYNGRWEDFFLKSRDWSDPAAVRAEIEKFAQKLAKDPLFKEYFEVGVTPTRDYLGSFGRAGKALGAFGLIAGIATISASAQSIGCEMKDFVHDRAKGEDDWAYVDALSVRQELNARGAFAGDVAMRSMYGWK